MRPHRAWCEIDLEAISGNLDAIRSRLAPGVRVMAVLKADAYGHGAIPVAWQLVRSGIDMIGVGDSREAIELRRVGIGVPILILGAIIEGEVERVVAYDIATSIHSTERIRKLSEEGHRQRRPVRVHLNVDTGMGRLGVGPAKALELAREIAEQRSLHLEGLYTHLSSVDGEIDPFTAEQLRLFRQTVATLEAEGLRIPVKHVSSSAAVFAEAGTDYDLVRPGLALFGLLPGEGQSDTLRPALDFRTQIVFLKDVPAGAPIGYHRRFVTQRPTRVATLPVGYNDGLSCNLGNCGHVLVRGQTAPIIGAISMDYTTVDVTDIRGVRPGDVVTLIGRDGKQRITASDIARQAGTITYEVLCSIGKRVQRDYKTRESASSISPIDGWIEEPGAWTEAAEGGAV